MKYYGVKILFSTFQQFLKYYGVEILFGSSRQIYNEYIVAMSNAMLVTLQHCLLFSSSAAAAAACGPAAFNIQPGE